jgi:2-polyprenyl-3-methyl-5-hydroxy-6-metoxy-1,4-benzoquinol methylase
MTQQTRLGKLPKHINPDRKFDQTSLKVVESGRVHRDYAAHFFRWGFAKKLITDKDTVLDVGCGVDTPFVRTTEGGYADGIPKHYTGVDLNNLSKAPHRSWATLHGGFNFIRDHACLGLFSKIICFEVLEHMRKPDGQRFLRALRAHLKPGGTLILSTPVFGGKAAANHLHEYTIPELATCFERAGFEVVERFGTFTSWNDLKKVITPEERALVEQLHRYYAHDVLACFLAPKYPDAARNNVWLCQRA